MAVRDFEVDFPPEWSQQEASRRLGLDTEDEHALHWIIELPNRFLICVIDREFQAPLAERGVITVRERETGRELGR